MGYSLMTEEQKDLVTLLHDVQLKHLAPLVKEYEPKGKFPMEFHDVMGELGFHGMSIPEEYGGLGLDLVSQYLLREELGMVEIGAGFTYALSKNPGLVIRAGSEEQKKYVCDFDLNGGITATCISEPNCGSDVPAMKTTARKVGDEYVINGRKTFVTNGTMAGLFTVIAYTDKDQGTRGMSAFLVERDREGVTIGKKEDKMGMRMSETCDVIFDDVRIPKDHLIGEEGKGYAYILATLSRARILNIASVVGLAQSALDYAVEYAKTRTSFGVPIKDHQGVAFMLADMEMQIQAARQYMIYGMKMCDAGLEREAAIVASGAKAYASEMAMKVTTDAVQIFGGYGYSKEYPVEKLMRDAKVFSIFEGTNQIQRLIMGRILTS